MLRFNGKFVVVDIPFDYCTIGKKIYGNSFLVPLHFLIR